MRAHIGPYTHGNRQNHEPERARKLLLKRREIERLGSKVQMKGLTVVPLRVLARGSWIKVEIALVQGKKLHDKRERERERELDREMDQALKQAQGRGLKSETGAMAAPAPSSAPTASERQDVVNTHGLRLPPDCRLCYTP